MRRQIILTPEAFDDVREAHAWYENQESGLGTKLLDGLGAAFARIGDAPDAYPVRFDAFRRVLLHRFPYAIYFDHHDTTVVVHCVFHCARDSAALRRRRADE